LEKQRLVGDRINVRKNCIRIVTFMSFLVTAFDRRWGMNDFGKASNYDAL